MKKMISVFLVMIMVLMTTISTSAASVTVYEIYHMMKYNSTNKNYDYYQIPLYWNM